jgi:hypothetical protein
MKTLWLLCVSDWVGNFQVIHKGQIIVNAPEFLHDAYLSLLLTSYVYTCFVIYLDLLKLK